MKIFNVIKAFLVPEAADNGDQAWRLARWRMLCHWVVIFSGGVLMAAAFPPLNLTIGAFCALTVLLLEARNRTPLKAALAGWVWGMGYALCSFFFITILGDEEFFLLLLFPFCR